MSPPTVRRAAPSDAPAMAALLNAVIAIGGSAAHEAPVTADEIPRSCIDGPDNIAGHVAFDGDRLLGFQSIERWPDLPPGRADIATFVDPTLQRGGVGGALFAATREAAQAAGITTINATIRAGNRSGLGYDARIGFTDYATDPGFCLTSGARVGRISRRDDLA